MKGLNDYELQGLSLDDHVQAYLEVDNREIAGLNIPLRIEEGRA